MTNEKKLELIAEVLDIDVEEISPETELESLESWDSIALITFIAMMDDEFDKVVKGADIKGKKTLGELMAIMEE